MIGSPITLCSLVSFVLLSSTLRVTAHSRVATIFSCCSIVVIDVVLRLVGKLRIRNVELEAKFADLTEKYLSSQVTFYPTWTFTL